MGIIVKNKVAYGGGENIEIDTTLSTESTNPVQNKVVTEAINNLTETVNDVDTKATEASNIAKGRNQAHVFSTTAAMEEFLSNADNAGLYNVGDNLYIVEVDVPDWWISEVLTEPDADTGFYYKIGQLETQKVDLTNYATKSDANSKLPLAGGTMTGDLNVQSVVPTTALTNACGSYAKPFHGMYAGKHVLVDSSGRDVGSIVNAVTGTPSTEGLARLQLGNSIANGTDGNSTGELLLFNAKGAYTNVVPSDTNAANIWHVLPSKAGYIPVVSVVGNTLYIDT